MTFKMIKVHTMFIDLYELFFTKQGAYMYGDLMQQSVLSVNEGFFRDKSICYLNDSIEVFACLRYHTTVSLEERSIYTVYMYIWNVHSIKLKIISL